MENETKLEQKIFDTKNLVEFELEFFKRDSQYINLRYGQAVYNVFGVGGTKLFYEKDNCYARDIVWLLVKE
jgi:hypothetical protein